MPISPHTILLASKNNLLVHAVKDGLSDLDFITTENGTTVLEKVLEQPYRIIIIDSDLSDINGYETALLLLGAYHSQDIPIVLIAPDNDKTAKWKKFNDDTNKIHILSNEETANSIIYEIRRILNLTASIDKALTSSESKKSTKNKTILAVDDMSVNLMALEIVIQKLGHELYTAQNGKDAIELCQKHDFDLIFMDCQMPEMDGFETTKKIKRIYTQKKHSVPIIALTAHAHKEDRNKCLKHGMHDYLTKPVIKNDIINMIEKWTSQPQEATE